MARLDRSIDDINKIISRRIQQSTLEGRKRIYEWKGRKLCNAEKWRKFVSSCDDPMEILDYIPNSFVEYPFTGCDGTLPPESAIGEWFDVYYEYLGFVRDSKFGRNVCGHCILNPKVSFKPMFFRDLVIGKLKLEMNPQFPCTVVNVFKCPYEKKSDSLLFAGSCWQILSEALIHAYLITSESDDIYHIDYDKGMAGPRPDGLYLKIEESVAKLILPTVPVRTRKDVYDILTVKKNLAGLIDQYLDGLKMEVFRVSRMEIGKSNLSHRLIEEERDSIIEFFSSMKKSLKIENMGNLYAEGVTRRDDSEEFLQAMTSPAKCVLCGTVARIHCVNCDSWVCIEHWQEHGVKVHNYISR